MSPLLSPPAHRPRLNFVLEHFQVLREFARGGLGILYLAQDKRLQRNVILKKIRPEHARSGVARDKFVLEAEVTGQLEHPGIVPIYALGTDGQREPYYAMRLISGQNLHEAIRQFHTEQSSSTRLFDGLRFRELLQRFIDVCHALHYAHSRNIIHRDLKPANIMLGGHGETLVIDWGLAKALSSSIQANSRQALTPTPEASTLSPPIQLSGEIDHSMEGAFAGTARYAPPEQLDGQIQQLCPASDIYSLGAILVELLCNQPALAGPLDNAKQALAKINAGQVRAPRDIISTVPRPLNAICVKAMAINIPDRYASAQALAEDVQRWLADECVLAYRPQETRLEKVGRWLRHNRSWAAGIALSLVALSVSALTANYFINRARLNEQTAKRQAVEYKEDAVTRYRVAKSAVDTLMERSDKLLDIKGTQAIRAQLLQEAATRYEQLSQSESLDPELEIERARALVRLADVLMLQNQNDKAIDTYDQVVRMLTPDATDGETVVLLPNKELLRLVELGRTFTRRALALQNVQKFQLARSDYNRSIDLLKELQKQHADSKPLLGNLAIAQLSLAALEEEQGRDAVALGLAQDGLRVYQLPDLATERLFAVNLVRTHQLLERLSRKLGRREEAIKHLGLADETLSQLLKQYPQDPQLSELRADLWVSVASQARRYGDYLGALKALETSLTVYEQLEQQWAGGTSYVLGMAIAHLDLALVHQDLEQYPQGEPHLEMAFRLFRSLRDSVPQGQLAAHEADTLDVAGMYLLATGGAMPEVDATGHFLDAMALLNPLIERSKGQPEAIGLAIQAVRIKSHQAQDDASRKSIKEARDNFEQAVSGLESIISQAATTDAKRQLAHTLWHKGVMEHDQQEQDLATAHFQRALGLWREVTESEPTPLHRFELGRFYLRCPIAQLQNLRLALEHAQACTRAIPDNPIFAKLLADTQQAMRLSDKKLRDKKINSQ